LLLLIQPYAIPTTYVHAEKLLKLFNNTSNSDSGDSVGVLLLYSNKFKGHYIVDGFMATINRFK